MEHSPVSQAFPTAAATVAKESSLPSPTTPLPEPTQDLVPEEVVNQEPAPLPETPTVYDGLDVEALRPDRIISEVDQRRFEASQEADAPGFIAASKAAWELEATFSWLFQDRPEMIPEENYQISKERWAELTTDLPEELHEVFEDAVSDGHATALREKLVSIIELEKTLEAYGWSGVGLRMLAAILDPTALVLSLAADGLAAPFIYGQKATRLVRAARAGMVAAGTNAGIEAYLVSQNPVKNPLDILFAATGGAILGGGIGAALPNRAWGDAMKDLNNAVLKSEIEELGGVLTEKGVKRLAPTVRAGSPSVRAEAPLIHATAPVLAADTSAGAKQVGFIPTSDPMRGGTDDFLAATADAPKTVWGGARIDMSAYLKSSDFAPFRAFGNRLLEDGLGNTGGEKAGRTADLEKTILYKRTIRDYHVVYQPAYRAWAKEQGYGTIRRAQPKNRVKFGSEVADAIENPDMKVFHPEVLKVAAKQSELSATLLKDLREAGVRGFEETAEDVKYFTRRWRYDRVVAAHQKDALGTVALFKGAIIRGSSQLSEELAESIAKGMVKTLREVNYGNEIGIGRVFSQEGKAALKTILHDEGIVDADDFDALLAKFDPVKGTGKPGIAKFRVRMDTSYELNGLRIRDLLDRDAESVFDSYVSQATGRIALARNVGIRSDGDLDKLKADMISAADELGFSKTKLDQGLRIIDISTSLILGRPAARQIIDPKGTTGRILRLIMDYNFIRVMGQVGFAQIPELANVLGQGGIRVLMQQVPEFGSLLRSARLGQHDTVAAELEAWAGLGRDRLIHQASLRFDPEDGLIEADDVIGKLSAYAQVGRRMVADLSAMAPITDFSSRIAARVVTQNLTDEAFNLGARVSTKRLLDMGLDEDTAAAVFKQIRKHALTEDSAIFANKKIRRINLEQWTDTQARDDFIFAVTRTTRRWIQQNDVGNLSRFMTDSLGKMLIQFRVFAIVSYNKQFLYGLHNRDMRTAISWLGATFLAGSSYVMQQSINSIGQENQEGFLEKRLSIEEIAKASFQRAGYAHLMPGILDIASGFYTDDPIFKYGRTTSLASDLLTGNPTVDMFMKGQAGVQGFARAMLNDDFQLSQTNIRNVKSILPFHTITGVRNIISAIGNDLPQRSR